LEVIPRFQLGGLRDKKLEVWYGSLLVSRQIWD